MARQRNFRVKANFSVQLSAENYEYLSSLACRENPSWPSTADRMINRIVDDLRAIKSGAAKGAAV